MPPYDVPGGRAWQRVKQFDDARGLPAEPPPSVVAEVRGKKSSKRPAKKKQQKKK